MLIEPYAMTYRLIVLALGTVAAIHAVAISAAHAQLRIDARPVDGGGAIVFVRGPFGVTDQSNELSQTIIRSNATVVTFDSPGGNVAHAIALGETIRAHGLPTMQIRRADCASACALAFMGGTTRMAEPGSIGLHRSSFAGHSRTSNQAVDDIQRSMAEVMSYMNRMGVDSRVLEIALRHSADDMRYLTGEEMQRYAVVTGQFGDNPQPPRSSTLIPPTTAGRDIRVQPVIRSPARSGTVRRPSGPAPLLAKPSTSARKLHSYENGTPLRILSSHDRFYEVGLGGEVGYMHKTWIFVDQFHQGPFEHRHVQIKSLSDLDAAARYAAGHSLPLGVFRASNGMYAITLAGTYPLGTATDMLERLKREERIPSDSFATYGNTYVQKMCCD